ncbi:DNA-processing protein DprA [Massilia sp. 2TAF26]|uniref:DNA-processing protein DprA n=1 Tax=Massilia sp. 2TAF26 TaxID=3233012 RepID=UPI003F95B7C8
MIETSAKTAFLLAFSMLKGVGPAMLRKIAAVPAFESLPVEHVATQVPQLRKILDDQDAWPRALEAAASQLDQAERYKAWILSPFDPSYPNLLARAKDDPFLLFVRGTLAPDPAKSIAIIGTREPTPHGEGATVRLTKYFGEQGWSIVSGLALGCDAISHRTAVETGAHTIAVLAHGLHTVSPSANRKLAESILDAGGALVSQYPFGQGAQKAYFVQRDRVQAGLAQGVVMMQSDVKGGSLHASRAALDYDRWLIVPYPTSADRENKEPKIQANLLLADGKDFEKADLLRCHTNSLVRLMVIRTKEDYPAMLEKLRSNEEILPSLQGSLV